MICKDTIKADNFLGCATELSLNVGDLNFTDGTVTRNTAGDIIINENVDFPMWTYELIK